MPRENERLSVSQDARMRYLVDRLNEANRAYYENDNPIMPDVQWDKLYDELVLLEKETGLRLPGSPTRRVGGQPLAVFLQHRHVSRLWSMDKVQDFAGLAAWVQRVEKLASQAGHAGEISYFVEYKLDGLTLNLTYNHGELLQAATRGNGEVGEAILPQAMTVRSVPLAIPYQGLLEVQGECIMRLSVLKKYNETASEPLKNARNAAAGALRNLDPAVTASRKLDAFFYQVGTILPPDPVDGSSGLASPPFHDQAGMIAFLQENGFPLGPYRKEAKSLEELKTSIQEIIDSREKLDFLIDGAVVKVSDFSLRNALGYTDKFPRWAVAYKFEAEENITTLLNVVWEPGRTGKLTPLAHLTPVDFGGVTVKRATLNNWGDIQRKKVAIGAQVGIRRSNDVIPEIMGRVGEPGPEETAIEKPERCPSCGGPIVERGAHLYCMNRLTCRPQAVARIAHFAGRDAMDIETFSEKTAGLLHDTFGIKDPAGLYALTKEQLLSLEGFKEKTAASSGPRGGGGQPSLRPGRLFVRAGHPQCGPQNRPRSGQSLRNAGKAESRRAGGADRHPRGGGCGGPKHRGFLLLPGEHRNGRPSFGRGRNAPGGEKGGRRCFERPHCGGNRHAANPFPHRGGRPYPQAWRRGRRQRQPQDLLCTPGRKRRQQAAKGAGAGHPGN